MIIGQNRDGTNVTAADLKADGAMSVLLKDAMAPNLVQTLEGSPALVHGGPFANIAHGCNSVMATRLGMKLAEIVVTEAGFGADLGGEKFLDIKCRSAGLKPSCAVVVATVRALKMHGGVARDALGPENVGAVKRGIANLQRHVENLQKFGLPVVVGVNHFNSDTEAEFEAIRDAMAALGTEAISCTHWARGGAGAEDLARAVVSRIEAGTARLPAALSAGDGADGQNPHDRDGDLPRSRYSRHGRGGEKAGLVRGCRVSGCAGVHRQDAV